MASLEVILARMNNLSERLWERIFEAEEMTTTQALRNNKGHMCAEADAVGSYKDLAFIQCDREPCVQSDLNNRF